jgi:hypothetical protein
MGPQLYGRFQTDTQVSDSPPTNDALLKFHTIFRVKHGPGGEDQITGVSINAIAPRDVLSSHSIPSSFNPTIGHMV